MKRDYENTDRAEFGDLLGKTLTKITQKEDYQLIFETDKGEVYEMFHDQDCCEVVVIEDICGDLNDLIGSPITQAEESSNSDDVNSGYRIATQKGSVVIRWWGSSNGYYSESVDFYKKIKP